MIQIIIDSPTNIKGRAKKINQTRTGNQTGAQTKAHGQLITPPIFKYVKKADIRIIHIRLNSNFLFFMLSPNYIKEIL